MGMKRIYLASSWRNLQQPALVGWLRDIGHQVYDFRNPGPGDNGFSWSSIDPGWLTWTADEYIRALRHPIASRGFGSDMTGLDWADTCVLLLPCGRSAHLEAGYAIGQGKPTFIVLGEGGFEPELMYLMAAKVVEDRHQLVRELAK